MNIEEPEMVAIDIDRCRRGMRQLSVRGVPRAGLIATAIGMIQTNANTALRQEYLGIKNYEAFGDQREDHRYGFGPKHGSIVFSIGRVSPSNGPPLDDDAIYLLEAYRDFGTTKRKVYRDGRTIDERWSICDVIREHDRLSEQLREMRSLLDAARMTDHAAERLATRQ